MESKCQNFFVIFVYFHSIIFLWKKLLKFEFLQARIHQPNNFKYPPLNFDNTSKKLQKTLEKKYFTTNF
jgi:hypothetical protein